MNKLFALLAFIFYFWSANSQTVIPIEICETKSVANIGKNRNEFLHSLSPPTLNNGYQHNITVPTLSPPPVCDAELTGILVKTDITSYTNDLPAINSANGTTCSLYGWFVDVFYDCGGPACPVVQQVNGGCFANNPILSTGNYDLEILSCPAVSTIPNGVLNIDVVPAMEYPSANCPDICNAMPLGWVDVEYTLCVEFQFTVTDPPVATASNTGPYCYGEDIELEIDEAGYNYDWDGPNSFSSTEQNPIINNATELDAGIYTVTVSSAPGCEVVLTTEVEVGEEIVVTIIDQEDPTCNGFDDGIGEVEATGGYGNYIFDWTDGFTGDYVDQLEGGIEYQILVTDEEGCEGVAYLELDDPDLLEIDLVDFTDPSCPGAQDGEADFFATGGDGFYDYDWNPGGYIDPIVSTLSGGITYDITVFDGNGCEAYGSVTLTDPPPTNIQFTNTGPFCLENTTQQIMATPTPGTFSGAVDASGSFNPSTLGVGTYRAYYDHSASANCTAIDSVDFMITAPLAITFGDSVFCQSATTALLTAVPTNGTWSGTGINSTTGEIDPSNLGVGIHIFTYSFTDPTTNCTSTKNIMVEVETQPTIMIIGDDNFCQSAGNQSFTATPTGGTWGGVVNNMGQVDASTLTVGSHDVIYSVTDGTCSNTSTLTITVTEPPTATMSGGGTICPGGTVNANLDFVLTGTGSWVIEFTLDAVPQIPINVSGSPHQHSVGQPGTYAITSVTDASGCVGTVNGTATVSQITPLAISNIQTQCDPTNTNYVVTFEISGGDPATYMVTGVAGSISGTGPYIFTSQNIAQGTTTSFTVSDNSACAAVSDNVTVNCACTTEVGTMDPNMITICGNGTANGTYDNSNQFLDGDDLLQFVLHTNSGISLGTIVASNGTPVFSFGGSISYGTTYYLSAIVGNNDGGNVDLTDPCLKIAQGTPVVFNEIPTATLSGDATICAGENATLSFVLTGASPWNIQYSDGTNTFDLNGVTTSPLDIMIMPTMTTNYSLSSVENTDCVGTINGSANITVNTPPTATVTTTAEVCNSSQSGNATTLNFSTLITAGDMTGSWTDVDGSGATGTFSDLNFDGLTAGNYTFRYTTGAAQAPCTNVSYAVIVTVRDCACPSVLTMGAGPFCNNDARVDLTPLTLTMEPGIWSILSAPGGSTATLTGSIFNANNSVGGDYELEFTLNTPTAGCPESSTQTIQIFEQPTASVTNTASICNSSQTSNPTTLDFSTLITAGNMTGTWIDVDGSGATGTFSNLDFESIAPGDYTFRYSTTTAQAPCVDASYDVTITVRDCACPSVLTTGAGPFCNDNATLDLTGLTLTTEAGSWSILSAPAGSTATLSGNNFDANGSAAGNYELEFTLDSPVMGCPASSTQTIQVHAPPSATITTDAEVCNSSQSGDPTNFDFRSLITAGDMSGSWIDIDGSGATGSFPDLDFESIATGDYSFRYTTNSAQTPCVEATYDVTITVRDCTCPSVLTTGVGPFCNDNATLDLTDLTLTTEAGSWSILSAPSGSTASLSGNNFDANGSAAGDYELEFTLDSPVMGCPASSTQTIQVHAPPSATITTDAEVCNSSQSGDPTNFNFSSLVLY